MLSPRTKEARRFVDQKTNEQTLRVEANEVLVLPRRLTISPDTTEWYEIRCKPPVRINVSCRDLIVEPKTLEINDEKPRYIRVSCPCAFDVHKPIVQIWHYVLAEEVIASCFLQVHCFKTSSGSLVGFPKDCQIHVPGATSKDWDFEGYVSDSSDELDLVKLRHRADKGAGRPGESDKIVGLAAGNSHAVVVCFDGSVCCRGSNDKGQLGVSKIKESTSLIRISVECSSRVIISSVACGHDHTCAVSTAGSLFAWGDNSHGQLGVGDSDPRWTPARLPIEATRVACGMFHSIAYGDGVYAWGQRINGALGLPAALQCELAPVKVTDMHVFQLACGAFHSALIDSNGNLLTCGLTEDGQLGRVGASSSFERVALRNKKAVRVACGSAHTLVLTSSKDVYGFGSNNYGQLGLGDTLARRRPCRVHALYNATIFGIQAGHSASAAWTESGALYVWGLSGSRVYAPCPCLVSTLSHARTRHVVFSGTSAMALTDIPLVGVKKLQRTARQFYASTALHFKLAASMSKSRRVWLRRRKVFLLVNGVETANISNQKVRNTLLDAARTAKLKRLLRKQKTNVRSAVASALFDLDFQVQQYWGQNKKTTRPGLRAAVPVVLDFLGALPSRPLRASCVALKAAYDFHVLGHLEHLFRRQKKMATVVRAFRRRSFARIADMAARIRDNRVPPPSEEPVKRKRRRHKKIVIVPVAEPAPPVQRPQSARAATPPPPPKPRPPPKVKKARVYRRACFDKPVLWRRRRLPPDVLQHIEDIRSLLEG